MRRLWRWLRFVSASGGQMGRYDEKTATFRTGRSEAVVSLGFQVSEAQEPLAAVWRTAGQGDSVQLGRGMMITFSRASIRRGRGWGSCVITADYVVQEPVFAGQATM